MPLIDLARSAVRGFRRELVHTLGATRPLFPLTDASALVMAPHPDDEAFGCGGLIAAKRQRGAAVTLLFLTAGEASHRNCCDLAPSEIAAQRRRQAIHAASTLGVPSSSCIFWELPDGQLPHPPSPGFLPLVERLTAFLNQQQPAEIFCTNASEVWSDHVAAAKLAQAALRRASLPAALWSYLVWAPLNQSAKGLLDLSWRQARRLPLQEFYAKKFAAMRVYLNGPHPPCGRPWVGHLPQDFLRFFDQPCELFFAWKQPAQNGFSAASQMR